MEKITNPFRFIIRKRALAVSFLLLSGLCLIPSADGKQLSAKELFQEGNKSYEAGNMAEAQNLYNKIIRQGLGNAHLYFNLGNTYYRTGQIGLARLWYERALTESPHDNDIRHNLDIVRSRIGEKQNIGKNWFRENASLILWTAAAVNFVFFTILVMSLYDQKEWLWWARWLSGIVFLAGLFFTAMTVSASRQIYGIIIDQRVEVRTGPGMENRVGFIVPEGQKVVVFNTLSSWKQIGVPEKGLKGWVQNKTVKQVSVMSNW